ncbi:MAG: Ku protein [Pseudomonadales bacterium]
MPDDADDDAPRQPRSFWSGNIAFGLVSVPVSLFVASRASGAGLRMVSADGTPLTRRYFCSSEGVPVDAEEIVRGYEVEKGNFVIVGDEELAALAPEKSQEIDLRRFVPLSQIDPMYFDRAYFLVPDRGASKAYRLLARVMEDVGRAGIATFVMRGKEYLVAIIAERGLLRAETLRFDDELRTPEDVGLPELESAPAAGFRAVQRAMRALAADSLNRDALSDSYSRQLRELVEHKLAAGEGVVAAEELEPEEASAGAEIVDLMQVLKQSLEEGEPRERKGSAQRKAAAHRKDPAQRKAPRRAPRAAARPDLESRPKAELYEQARALDIPGRSSMSKEQLIDAIRSAG